MKSTLLLCALFSMLFNCLQSQPVIQQDSAALVSLFNHTGGASWSNHQNWLTGNPVSTWFGVTISSNRVITLTLNSNNLTGSLPDSISYLTGLTSLNLSKNKITGDIPSTIGRLSALTSLNLSANSFTGSLPDSIGLLTGLTLLNMHNSKISGSIPSTIGNLVRINILDLSHNNLTGSIPSTVGNLTKAATMDLSFNQLSGSLPAEIGNMDSLKTLSLGINELSGNIPAALGNLKKLGTFTINVNQLTGSIPASFGNLSSLYQLDLSNNELSGAIPATLGNATTAQIISVNNNELTGNIPSSISKIRGLLILDVSTNQLTGSIPLSIFSIPTLEYIEAYLNQFTDGPDLSSLSRSFPILTLAIGANRYTFKTLEYVGGHIPQGYYDPQAPIEIHQHNSKLAVSAGGTLSNNTYVWYKAGSTTSTTIIGDSTFIPTETGSYYANIFNSVATGTVLTTDTVSYSTVTAITQNKPVSLYPNPARSILTVKGLNANLKNIITITDIAGNRRIYIVADKQTFVQCDISRLEPGSYTLKVSNTSNSNSLLFQKQ